ncbi:hypothetical protein BU25DRAFT_477657 [Macroventuria anomochaeta]|uniref:Uncharacterized protein n=1 Tax=Macroventuria anomochaeta TaxID=301207 RepID=A0ACB6RS05_9PLEO|nr:uncharacterized protein BU25DRAFT_477657 [Macroventuria anomochaeta]KAF2623707.1 hypothetical protein BU25DRAFT_477657 [Macroventuria anomochaeta]
MILKWSIGFTILRIAVEERRWVIWPIYTALVLTTVASASTGMFRLVQDADALADGGECINRKYLVAVSTTLAAVSIATDWYMALIVEKLIRYNPIPLLCNIQMESCIKLSVIGLLALGTLQDHPPSRTMSSIHNFHSASIAGIVRFAMIVRSTPDIVTGVDHLYILDPIMTWARAEPAIGMIAANLLALRPLREKALNSISTSHLVTNPIIRAGCQAPGRATIWSSVH